MFNENTKDSWQRLTHKEKAQELSREILKIISDKMGVWGQDELLSVSERYAVTEYAWGRVILPPSGQCDALIVSAHSGVEVPPALIELLQLDTLEQAHKYVESTISNIDIGVRAMISRILHHDSQGKKLGVGVIHFDLSRVLVDANRLQPEEMVKLLPYAGELLFAEATLLERRQLFAALVEDFVRTCIDVQAATQPGIVIHTHTYDIASGQGNLRPDASYKDNCSGLRPPAQLFLEYGNHQKQNIEKAFGIFTENYQPEVPFELTFLNQDELAVIFQLLSDAVTHMTDPLSEAQTTRVGVDFPYSSPIMPPALLRFINQIVPHLVFEFRKDLLFYKGNFEQIVGFLQKTVAQFKTN